jgi:DNA repair photolyase
MIKGKGAQSNPPNPFLKQETGISHVEGIDEGFEVEKPRLEIFYESAKEVISKNSSEDIPFEYSINPYQGCEHGCVYCYARNSHTYWGFSAGLDFESKIIVKRDVAQKFEARILNKNWKVAPVMLSGNTDCYQPIEKQYGLTRQLLQVALKYQHPVSIITKNALITRDIDLLSELAKLGLVSVHISITSTDEQLRLKLEPRTASFKKKIEAIELLCRAGVPVAVMNAPIIPGLNDHDIPNVVAATADAGALDIHYTVVRLNGQIGKIFQEWMEQAYPNKADKVMNQIKEMHGGKVNDSDYGKRMSGEGNYAQIIHQLFQKSKQRYYSGRSMPPLNVGLFRRGGNYSLF